jgi:putative transposase
LDRAAGVAGNPCAEWGFVKTWSREGGAEQRAGLATRVVFDLDPGEGVTFRQLCEVAHEVRELITGIGLTILPVTSGSKGLHAAMESFFALLQRNVLDWQRWSTRAELRLAIVTWIERTYHRRRRQRALGKLTPIEFELLHTPVATAA